MMMIRELNEYFERFEREKEIRNLQPEDTYICKIPVRLFELLKSSLRPGQPELDVIASKLDEKYDNAPEIPGFSHNEQKNREELDKLADQLKATCAELKYIQTKDVKRHVVEYLAKKKRKRKTNSRKDKGGKLGGGEPKRPCYSREAQQPKSESLKNCQNKPPRGRYNVQRVAQPMLTTEESQARNHQDSLLIIPRHPVPLNTNTQSSYMTPAAGTNTGMDLEAENLSRFAYSFRGLEEAYQQNDNVDNNAGGIPLMPSLMKQSPTPKTFQDYQQQMQQQQQMSVAMGSPPQHQQQPQTEKGLPPLNQQYASSQAEDGFNMGGVDYMTMMAAGSNTFGGSGTDQMFDQDMPMANSSMASMGYQMLAGGRMWAMDGPC